MPEHTAGTREEWQAARRQGSGGRVPVAGPPPEPLTVHHAGLGDALRVQFRQIALFVAAPRSLGGARITSTRFSKAWWPLPQRRPASWHRHGCDRHSQRLATCVGPAR